MNGLLRLQQRLERNIGGLILLGHGTAATRSLSQPLAFNSHAIFDVLQVWIVGLLGLGLETPAPHQHLVQVVAMFFRPLGHVAHDYVLGFPTSPWLRQSILMQGVQLDKGSAH